MDEKFVGEVSDYFQHFGNPFDSYALNDCLNKFGSRLNSEGVSVLEKMILDCGLTKEASEYLAKRIPCAYLYDVEYYKKEPRNAKYQRDFDEIFESALRFERSLKAASKKSITLLEMMIGDDYAEERMIESPLIDIKRMVFAPHRGKDSVIDPKFLFAIRDIANVAKVLRDQTPPDSGGVKSGQHDSSGATARKLLTLNIRLFLKKRGKAYGCHKGGPVPDFLKCIHKAATGEIPSWADRFASMASSLEKQAKESEKSLARTLDSIEYECGVKDERRNNRLNDYYSATGEAQP